MLFRSVYNPTVAELIPATLASLESWDGEGTPDSAVLTAMAIELKRLQEQRNAGRLAEAINSACPARRASSSRPRAGCAGSTMRSWPAAVLSCCWMPTRDGPIPTCG